MKARAKKIGITAIGRGRADAGYDTALHDLQGRHSEQMRSFEVHTQEKLQLLEELGDFAKKRAEIEAEYASRLDRLVEKYKTRMVSKYVAAHDLEAKAAAQFLKDDTGRAGTTTHYVWRTILDCTKDISRMHSTISHTFSSDVGDAVNNLLRITASASKQCQENGLRLQESCQHSLSELEEAVRALALHEGRLEAARVKVASVKDKLRSGKSKTSTNPFGKKKDMADELARVQDLLDRQSQRTKNARNTYLLALRASNAHKDRFFATEAIDLIDVLDGGYHRKMRELFTAISAVEQRACKEVMRSTRDLLDRCSRIDASLEKDIFIKSHQDAFTNPPEFVLVSTGSPAIADTETLLCDDESAPPLSRLLDNANARLRELRQDAEVYQESLAKAMTNATPTTGRSSSALVSRTGSETADKPATTPEATSDSDSTAADQLELEDDSYLGGRKVRRSSIHLDQTEDISHYVDVYASESLVQDDILKLETVVGAVREVMDDFLEAGGVVREEASGRMASTAHLMGGGSAASAGAGLTSMAGVSLTGGPLAEDGANEPATYMMLMGSSGGKRKRQRGGGATAAATAAAAASTVAAAVGDDFDAEGNAAAAVTNTSIADQDGPPPRPRPPPGRPPPPKTQPGGHEHGSGKTGKAGKTGRRGPSARAYGVNVQAYCTKTGLSVPFVVDTCIDAVERYGLQKEGIFRKSGQLALINQMKAELNKGRNPLANGPHNEDDVHAIAGAFKLYFRELPDPLFPHYDQLVSILRIADYEERLSGIRTYLHSDLFPPANLATLERLAVFLRKVSSQAHVNKMRVHNVAIVFGPTLLRPPPENMAAVITDAGVQSLLVENILTEIEWIFNGASALIKGKAADAAAAKVAADAASAAAAVAEAAEAEARNMAVEAIYATPVLKSEAPSETEQESDREMEIKEEGVFEDPLYGVPRRRSKTSDTVTADYAATGDGDDDDDDDDDGGGGGEGSSDEEEGSDEDDSDESSESDESDDEPDEIEVGYMMHAYTAMSETELTVKAGEEISVIAHGGDGWVRARRPDDTVGYVPESYVSVLCKRTNPRKKVKKSSIGGGDEQSMGEDSSKKQLQKKQEPEEEQSTTVVSRNLPRRVSVEPPCEAIDDEYATVVKKKSFSSTLDVTSEEIAAAAVDEPALTPPPPQRASSVTPSLPKRVEAAVLVEPTQGPPPPVRTGSVAGALSPAPPPGLGITKPLFKTPPPFTLDDDEDHTNVERQPPSAGNVSLPPNLNLPPPPPISLPSPTNSPLPPRPAPSAAPPDPDSAQFAMPPPPAASLPIDQSTGLLLDGPASRPASTSLSSLSSAPSTPKGLPPRVLNKPLKKVPFASVRSSVPNCPPTTAHPVTTDELDTSSDDNLPLPPPVDLADLPPPSFSSLPPPPPPPSAVSDTPLLPESPPTPPMRLSSDDDTAHLRSSPRKLTSPKLVRRTSDAKEDVPIGEPRDKDKAKPPRPAPPVSARVASAAALNAGRKPPPPLFQKHSSPSLTGSISAGSSNNSEASSAPLDVGSPAIPQRSSSATMRPPPPQKRPKPKAAVLPPSSSAAQRNSARSSRVSSDGPPPMDEMDDDEDLI